LSTHTNSVNAAVAPGRPTTAAGLRWRMLGVAVAAALAVDAYVHFHDARFYDSASPISQATLFRVQAVLAIAVAIALLVRPRPLVWALAVLVTASAAAAVVLYTYVNVGGLGPLANMYEPSWQVPGKLASAAFEAAGALLATAGLVLTVRTHPRATRAHATR
jgi:glucan phosphoethanolaminetransferase (alkaline phosphatase superfamily)